MKTWIAADRQLQLALQVVCLNHTLLRPPILTAPGTNKHAIPWTEEFEGQRLAKMRWDHTILIEEMIYSWINPRVAPQLRNLVVEVATVLEKTVFYSSISVTEYLSYRRNMASKVNKWIRMTAIRIARRRRGLTQFLPMLTRQKKSCGASAA